MSSRLVLADDHTMVLEGLTAALRQVEDVEVVATAGDGISALKHIRALGPDVAILDLHLPGRTGLEVASALARDGAATRVLLVTSFDDEATYRQALEGGVHGFLGKGASVERVVDGVRALARGESYFLSGVGAQVPLGPAPERDNPLTSREKEVLRLIATGLSTPEIAALLGTSPGTVKNQTSSILGKLGAKDRTRAVLVALRDGFI